MTLGIMLVCIGLFIIQTLMGVNPTEPDNQDLLRWGANFMPYTLSTEPWRMVSSLFLHIGFLHLLFNMFALYYFGQVIERLFGSFNTLLVYLLTGIGGNVLNNYLSWQAWQLDNGDNFAPALSAGASGGIMGFGGLLLVAVFFKIRGGEFRFSLSTLVWIMAINIGSGFVMPGIDNAGHIGGTLTGMVLGAFFVWAWRDFVMKNIDYDNRTIRQFQNFYGVKIGYAVVLIALLAIYWQLHQAFTQLPAVGLRVVN